MGDYTGAQKLYLCCGYFCSLLACIGVYFWLVLFYMESKNSPYLIYEMQKMDSISDNTDAINVYRWSFLITAIVSVLLRDKSSFYSSTSSAASHAAPAQCTSRRPRTKNWTMERASCHP